MAKHPANVEPADFTGAAKYLHLTTVSETKAQEALRRLYAQVIPPSQPRHRR